MVTDKPQTTFRELQEHLAADGVVVHHSTIQCTLQQSMLAELSGENFKSSFEG